MLSRILAKAEKATAFAGRYVDLEIAARWYKPALVAGTIGWAGRWILVALLASDFLSENASAQTLSGDSLPDEPSNTAFYIAAILGCMLIKWAGWTYGGIGYVHHRAHKAKSL